MDVVVQRVRTSWTTQSRGGAAATVRNAVPIAFPVPRAPRPMLHSIVQTEANAFEPFDEVVELAGTPRKVLFATGLELTDEGDLLRVYPQLRYPMPPRGRRPPAVRVGRGEWLRWQLNYRESWNAGWVYSLDTFNVGYGDVGAEAFLGAPDQVVEELGFLR
ncbi:hypothetical protein [Kribbella sp. NPDC051770]|uniref:hypothetical protein n=1 Tax=Kribbella sp. NPDC051770 TaxID=3155413 RepID=UPI003433FCD1